MGFTNEADEEKVEEEAAGTWLGAAAGEVMKMLV
jgi:hypothetical protein